MIPYFTNSDNEIIQLGHDGYGLWTGSSAPNVKTFPRTIGGIIKPSNQISKTVTANIYLVPPSGTTKTRVEYFQYQLNEELAKSPGTLLLSGNSYENVYVAGINFDPVITNNFLRYTIDFVLGDQDDGGVVNQLTAPDLYNFSRGRTLSFTTTQLDDEEKTFDFWHNVDSVRNLEVGISVLNSGKDGKEGKVIKSGGFEKISCACWFVTFNSDSRTSIEAYLYNMLNGPLGQVGTLVYNAPGNNTWNNCFLQGIRMGDELFAGARYELEFLTPLQC